MSIPIFLVKADFQTENKLKIFNLSAATMDSLWGKVECAFGVHESSLQAKYVDKDGEYIILDTDEELLLAFSICDVPLRVNLLPRASAPAAPVATPRNDTALALPVATPRHDTASALALPVARVSVSVFPPTPTP